MRLENRNQKQDNLIMWGLLIIGIVFFSYFMNRPTLSKATYWKGDSCSMVMAESLGAELMIINTPFKSVSIHKPSTLNDLIHREIRWRESLGQNDDCEPVIFEFTTRDPERNFTLEVPMFSNSRVDAGYQTCNFQDDDKMDTLIQEAISSDEVSARKAVITSSGYAVDTLGIWRKKPNEKLTLTTSHNNCR